MRMPPPSDEQFLDPALMRHALLDDTFRQIGATLDLDQMARGLINIVVPHFCNSAGLLMLESMVAADEPPGLPRGRVAPAAPARRRHRRRRPAPGTPRSPPVRSCGTRRERRTPSAWTPASRCGRPASRTTSALKIAESWLRRPVAKLLAGTSMLLLPAGGARGAARLHRLHPPGGLPPLRRLRHRDRHGVRLPRGDLHRQRPPVQPGARHRAHPAAQHAADRAVRALARSRSGTATCPAAS